MKFAGDAIFAEWRIKNKLIHSTEYQNEVYQCVHKAASCGASIVAKWSDYPVFDPHGVHITTMNVHCGLSYGKMVGIHVGNDYNRREFIVYGDAMDQVTRACSVASYGELLASPEAYQILKYSTTKFHLLRRKYFQRPKDPIKIASKRERYFNFEMKKQSLIANGSRYRYTKPQKNHEYTDKLDVISLKYFQKLLSLYVNSAIVLDEKKRGRNEGDVTAMQQRYRSEAELRPVYTLFIKPLIEAKVANDKKKNEKDFQLFNDIMQVVTSVLISFRGNFKQYIVDDKGKTNGIVILLKFNLVL